MADAGALVPVRGTRGAPDVGAGRAVGAGPAVGAVPSAAGPLRALLQDPDVTDVLVNGVHGVWVDRGRGTERVDVDLGGPAAVRALAVRLAASGGRRLDEASPVVDARLADGTRLHAVLPPLAPDGPLVSLRTPPRRAWTLDALVRAGTVAPGLADVLAAMVVRRVSFLVTGATGTGKTTLLAALLGLVPARERVLCVEETPELAPDHPHVVRLVARPPNVEGVGEVTLADLVRQAMRMRPDRVVLGECRGPEVRDVLTALNTGHDGGAATLHANGPADVPARLEALGATAGMSPEAVAAQAASALRVVLHLRREPVRHVAQVGLVGRDGTRLVVTTAARVEPLPDGAPVVRAGPAWRELLDLCGWPA